MIAVIPDLNGTGHVLLIEGIAPGATLQKRLATFEGQALPFRFEAFSFRNHPNWSAPDSTCTDAAFGKVTSKTGRRAMKATLRYSF